ncbi:hypothetical protein MKW94_008433 [Papaver nudicaule]|uniref:Pentatricopeptide repeat-containing protein n=1 Tax=Papaver nudicaule TaxID=74823 RepID=A0AA41VM60_PAPNU|nr:hypothetical protein [Papaver nudicaule]
MVLLMGCRGLEPDEVTYVNALSACVKSGDLETGRRMFGKLSNPSITSWNAIVSGYSQHGNYGEAIKLFREMQFLNTRPDRTTIASILSSCTGMGILEYGKQMRESGMIPTQFSYASVLNSCSRMASLFQGKQVHAQITKDGYTNDIFVGSALIDVYSKCGVVDGARQFFDDMYSKSIVAWNEMIHGYAQNGYGDEAVELFEELIRSGEKPDSITFIAVLTACSHSGLADVGIEILDSMEREHSVEPLVDHYTCVIDCLGRAGRFIEAEVLIDKMPYKDDPIVWEVLLSSCRVHANVDLARRAAEQLFKIDPQNSTPYVLLANLYASLGRWDDASAVRALMCGRGVEKNPGYSWIDSRNEENAFLAEDDLVGIMVK